jgi:nucleotide-binding universal stress UspA family protein
MRTIIVPVNFGANAANAARYAADLALATGTEIRLVHVIHTPSVFAPHPMPDFLFKELQESGYLLLNRLRTELVKRTGGKVRMEIDLEVGNIKQVMKVYCGRYDPFLVVMGAAGSAPEMRNGSNDAIDALKQLRYPLLVVPKDSVFYGAPKVAVACDDKDIDARLQSLLPFLKELRISLGTKFQVVHVVTDGDSFNGVLQKYEILHKELEEVGPSLNVVRRNSIGEGIDDYLQHNKADWLLVLPKKHALLEFHKSRAAEIVLGCAVPVLWVHE